MLIGDSFVNALNAIYPYRHEGLWVFDDPKVGLVQEPFVSGADVIIDHLTSHIPNAERGFRLMFSATPFPEFTVQLEWRRADLGGDWYYSSDLDSEGWLCPALLRYFDAPPMTIYAKFEPKAG